MNQLVRGLVTRFLEEQALSGLTDSQAFEQLAVWSLLEPDLPPGASLDDLTAGDETVGIDSIAVLANGDLVLDESDAEDLCAAEKTVDVDFYFIQAKTSQGFDRAQILNFGHAVEDFFSPTPSIAESTFVAERRKAKDKLYENSALFRRRRPVARLFYVTSGVVAKDPNLSSAIDASVKALEATSLFEAVEFTLVGAAELHRAFTKVQNREEATINFARRIAIPKLTGVQEAYLGVVGAAEMLKLIETPDSSIKKSIFYDNVRDFQDMNDVNKGILETLSDPTKAILFPVLNNGVTVVAQEVRAVGEDVTVLDYQVVNGCQTCHILHEARAGLTDDVLVPLRLIVTDQDQVTASITKATNSQTSVDEANLQALTDFQKELEAYFHGQLDKRRLYYERRSKQYSGQGVEQTRVISPLVQMRAFTAFILDEPHAASRYPRRLYDRVPGDIFAPHHRHDYYYTASLAWYRLDVAFRRKLLDAQLRTARYHILMAAKYLAQPDKPLPPLNSAKATEYCEGIVKLLIDESKSNDLFKRASEVVVPSGATVTRDSVRTERFTREVLDRLKSKVSVLH